MKLHLPVPPDHGVRRVDDGQLDVGSRGDPVEERRPVGRGLGRDDDDAGHRRPSFHADLPRRLARPQDRAVVAADAPVREEPVTRVVDREEVLSATGERDVPRRFLAGIRLVLAAGEVRVVVGLVDGEDARRRVDHRPHLSRAPDEPVVESGPADEERRQLAEEPGGKTK